MQRLIIDFETRSEVDLMREGLMKYATHESTDVLLLGWKMENHMSTSLWEPGQMHNLDFLECVGDAEYQFYAFNAEFELAIWNNVCVKKYGWPRLPLEQVTCLAALANRYGLPNQLSDVAHALKCKRMKNPGGHTLIQVFCTPKFNWPEHNGKRWDMFKQYCIDDVLVEEEVMQRLPAKELIETEREMYEYTVHMNTRGIPVDVESAKQILTVSRNYKDALQEDYNYLSELTDGAVTKITQVQRIKEYMDKRGFPIEDLTAHTVSVMLEQELPDDIAMLLEVRSQIGLSSIGKYLRIKEMQVDGKIFYSQRYYGAHTGRWTGSGVQLLNLPRAQVEEPDMEIAKFFDGTIVDDNPIKSARALIRPMIMAKEGKLICAADYSSIEYVVAEWFAGNREGLDRFAAGFDSYTDLASFMYNVPYDEVTKKQRQMAKMGVLLCQYGGGAMKLMESAYKQHNLKLTEVESASIVNGYRKLHEKVATMWYALSDAAVDAVHHPGRDIPLYNVVFKQVTDHVGTRWLTIRLPSGRRLFYNNPFIQIGRQGKPIVCHYGFNQKIKQWHVMQMIPGRITENIVQAASRDILVNGLRHCKNAGLDVIWTCYDEVICEVPEDKAEEQYKLLVDCMCRLEPWSLSIPVLAKGYYQKRYKKD